MEKKILKRVLAVALGFLLFGWLMTNIAFTVGSTDGFRATHERLIEVETRMAEIKPICSELDSLRQERSKLIDQTTDLINKEPPSQEASLPKNQIYKQDDFSIDRLAYAIAQAETQDCTTGMGVTKSNCFGLMAWPNGVRTGKTYSSKEESYEDFKRVWTKHYGGFPTWYMAQRWTGNDNPVVWYNNVKKYYEKKTQ